ncbi:MAG TPA: hypothetical protein VE007_07150 [Thermoanaerobaculia bacterium]|nr:hypothetical protein [Thermoanaerobaculia bacterium]
MKRVDLSFREFGFIVATRAALAAGIGILAGGRLSGRDRRRAGGILLAVGALTTPVAGYLLFGRGRRAEGR